MRLCDRLPQCAREQGHSGACATEAAARLLDVHATRFEELRTSELLRKAASALEVISSIRADLELAGELRSRASKLEANAEFPDPLADEEIADIELRLLRRIGEVRS